MSKPPPLTENQKRQLAILEPALRDAVRHADYAAAKDHAIDIQRLLRSSGHETRLMQAKVWLFEAALNAGQVLTAESGFIGIREKTNSRTKVYLEASALLVVCLLRQKKVEQAEPLIAEVFRSKTIKDPARRRVFVRALSRRYELEAFLAAVKEVGYEALDVDAIDAEAASLVRQGKTEDELYAQIGATLPSEVLAYVYKVDRATRLQLTVVEVQYLPPSANLEKKAEHGRSLFDALKLIIWKSMCDPKSEVYKAWCTEGLGMFLNKKYYATAVASAMLDVGFAVKAVAVAVVALLIRLGLDVYCERYRPGDIINDAARPS